MAKQPTDHKKKTSKSATAASAWKKSSAQPSGPIPLEVPSGNTALVRPVGMQAFIAEGLIPNSLLGAIMAQMEAAEKGATIDEDKLVEDFMDSIKVDPERITDMIRMADACTVFCVVEPQVLPAPESEVDRDDDLLYVDQVDLEDKLFIMNFAVGGSRALEPFRERLAQGVDRVSPSESVG